MPDSHADDQASAWVALIVLGGIVLWALICLLWPQKLLEQRIKAHKWQKSMNREPHEAPSQSEMNQYIRLTRMTSTIVLLLILILFIAVVVAPQAGWTW